MEELKKCMREAKKILDMTVGVMDASGMVIACTDPAWEGIEDSSARAVLLSDELFASTAGKTYMKVIIGEQTQYIAFIAGVDPIARKYLELMAQWIKAAMRERNTDVERETFIKSVLLENELPGDIPLKAREYKIPFATKRIVFIIRVSKADGAESLEILQNLFPDNKTQSVVAMDEETIVLVMDLGDSFNSFLVEVSSTILDNLNAESMIRAHIGIGMPAPTLRDIAKSYREAMLALRVGSIFESEQFIMRYDKLGLGRLIYQLPPTLCNMFLSEVFPKGAYESLDSDTLVTIASFFENNLNGSETSRKLFVHRNTLVYRLDKVQKITGLDLRSFDDAVLFKLAAMVRTYLEKQERSNGSGITTW
ncbi:MAG TPA: helix-turn-helix domain-containing protein [Bacillota bacterium]|nr:helix-turn-helix domain-containing protein [Bacillota bacterium]HPE37904.1 helix-turn-helix domain-containing protein [Bacillota bacterium]